MSRPTNQSSPTGSGPQNPGKPRRQPAWLGCWWKWRLRQCTGQICRSLRAGGQACPGLAPVRWWERSKLSALPGTDCVCTACIIVVVIIDWAPPRQVATVEASLQSFNGLEVDGWWCGGPGGAAPCPPSGARDAQVALCLLSKAAQIPGPRRFLFIDDPQMCVRLRPRSPSAAHCRGRSSPPPLGGCQHPVTGVPPPTCAALLGGSAVSGLAMVMATPHHGPAHCHLSACIRHLPCCQCHTSSRCSSAV